MTKIKGLRWWIIGLICLGTIINYLARNSLSVMAPTLKETLHFSTQEYSYIVAAFQVAYCFMQPVAGYVLDFLGLRIGYFVFALLWSAFIMLHGTASSWVGIATWRGLLGVAEASALPAGVKCVGEWFPAKERSQAVGWFNAGTSLGAMLAPPLIIFIAMQYSWQMAFVVPGLLGLVWAFLWLWLYRNPKDSRALSDEERAYILAGQAPPSSEKVSLKQIVPTKKFWAIALPRFLAEPAWQTFNFWIPLYLVNERGMDIKTMALFAWMPFLTADLGSILGGYLSPFFMKYFNMKVINSRIAGVWFGAVFMIAPALIGLATSPYVAILLFCLGGFAHQIISGMLNTMSADVFKPNELGTANGLTGMISWMGGLSFSLIVGALATTIGYNPLFVCLTLFDVVGAIIVVSLLRNYPVTAKEIAEYQGGEKL